MKIYVASPLNAPDAAGYLQNVSKMIKIANQIRKKGHAVYIPAFDLLLGIVDGEMTRDEFLDFNLSWVEVCDALYFGGESKGTLIELCRAENLHKRIFYSIKDIPNEKRKGEIE